MIGLGVLLALACALASNLGFFLKHRGACAAPCVDVRRPLRSAAGLFRSGWFSLGMLVALGAWALHVAALALAPLTIVQVVLSSGVVLIAVMADRLFGFPVARRQWWGLALTAAGLVLLGLSMPGVEGSHSRFSGPELLAFEAVLFAIGGFLVLGTRADGVRREHQGVLLAAAAGVLFGVGGVAVKALTGIVGAEGLMGLVTPWTVSAALASVTAFFASARSLQLGEPVAVIAVTGTAASVATIAGGIVVFGDPLPQDAVGAIAQAAGLLLVVVAGALTPAPVRSAQVATA